MKSAYQVVVTEGSIVVSSKGIFQTSIPLRQYSTLDGSTWSGSLRQAHQIDWLVEKLTLALNDSTTESTMQRVLRVLANTAMPPRVSPRRRPRGGAPLKLLVEASLTPSLTPSPGRSRLRRHRQHPPMQSPQPTIRVILTMSP